MRDGANQALKGFLIWDYPSRVNVFRGCVLTKEVGLAFQGMGYLLPRRDPRGRLDHLVMSAWCKCPGLNTYNRKKA